MRLVIENDPTNDGVVRVFNNNMIYAHFFNMKDAEQYLETRKAIQTIARHFIGINSDDLTHVEKGILKTLMNLKAVKINTEGEIVDNAV